MNCCERCFGTGPSSGFSAAGTGDLHCCENCGAQDVELFNCSDLPTISAWLRQILDLYEPCSDGRCGLKLSDILVKDWHFFSRSNNRIHELIRGLVPEGDRLLGAEFVALKDTFAQTVKEYRILQEDDGVRQMDWYEFGQHLKRCYRLCHDNVAVDKLRLFLKAAATDLGAGTIYHRARVSRDGVQGFDIEDMGAPPPHLASAGRANVHGIPVLYISRETDTSISEVRPGSGNLITVGNMELVKDVRVADLQQFAAFNPFSVAFQRTAGEAGLNWAQLYLQNKDLLASMAAEMRRPFQSDPLEYLGSQYLCEVARSAELDGIMYASAVATSGVNLALFDTDAAQCTGTKDYIIEDVIYKKFEQHRLVF